jgi:Resolvase, N terminal domain
MTRAVGRTIAIRLGLGPAQLKKLLATVGHGDVVIVAAVDRLSRDTTDSMVIARDLHKAGAGLRSLRLSSIDGSYRALRQKQGKPAIVLRSDDFTATDVRACELTPPQPPKP